MLGVFLDNWPCTSSISTSLPESWSPDGEATEPVNSLSIASAS